MEVESLPGVAGSLEWTAGSKQVNGQPNFAPNTYIFIHFLLIYF
jgi:hypothetical protein